MFGLERKKRYLALFYDLKKNALMGTCDFVKSLEKIKGNTYATETIRDSGSGIEVLADFYWKSSEKDKREKEIKQFYYGELDVREIVPV